MRSAPADCAWSRWKRRGGTPRPAPRRWPRASSVRTRVSTSTVFAKASSSSVSDDPGRFARSRQACGFDLSSAPAAADGLEEVLRFRAARAHRNPGVRSFHPYFTFDPASASSARAVCERARKSRAPFALTISGSRSTSIVAAGMEREVHQDPSASPAAPVCKPAPSTARSSRRRSSSRASRNGRRSTCAYCGVGCALHKAEMRGDEVVRMVPYKDGKANHGHSASKAASPGVTPITANASSSR